VPIDASTVAALTSYARRRDRHCPDPRDAAFLLCAAGMRLDRRAVGATFHALLAAVGITVPAGVRGPRLYDLRHTFAVDTLIDWHAAGLDVNRRLPALSSYLGHLNPANTYWYLEAVPQLMSVVADRLERSQGDAS
jgi:integrase